jgi:hypothetical protein
MGHSHVVVCSIIENQDVASKHCGCTQSIERQGTATRMKLSYNLCQKPTTSMVSLGWLTGHFSDIFWGPATISSSSALLFFTTKKIQIIVKNVRVRMNLTVLANFLASSVFAFLQFMDQLCDSCHLNKHDSKIVFLWREYLSAPGAQLDGEAKRTLC